MNAAADRPPARPGRDYRGRGGRNGATRAPPCSRARARHSAFDSRNRRSREAFSKASARIFASSRESRPAR